MAGRGRKPKPTHLRLLQGNAGKRPLNQNEPQPVGDLFEPPAELTASQVEIWTYAIANAPAGLLKMLDRDLLRMWAVSMDRYIRYGDKVEATGAILKGKDGGFYQNPYLSAQNKQGEIATKLASELGFTPSSRTKISVGDSAAAGGRAGKSANPWSEFA